MSTEAAETSTEPRELKKVIGPKLLVLLIIGDVIGAGVFAITGPVSKEVGGVAWLPFLVAFVVATFTAFSYLELVTKYPQAAGAALYIHKAFGIHFVTFIVAFAVACSGITSAATSSTLVGKNLLIGIGEFIPGIPNGPTASMLSAVAIIVVLGLVNLRGIGESVKFNVILTCVTLLAMGIVIAIGFAAIIGGQGELGRIVV